MNKMGEAIDLVTRFEIISLMFCGHLYKSISPQLEINRCAV